MSDRIVIIGAGQGVMVGGRFDGWRMRQHPDGQWVSVEKLSTADPYENLPVAFATICNVAPPPETYGGSPDEPWTGRLSEAGGWGGRVLLRKEDAQLALSALDSFMGDTDPLEDTPALLACQALSAALEAPQKQGDLTVEERLLERMAQVQELFNENRRLRAALAKPASELGSGRNLADANQNKEPSP